MSLKSEVMARDGLTNDEFDELLEIAEGELEDGETLENVLFEIFEVEPDYSEDLIALLEARGCVFVEAEDDAEIDGQTLND